MPACVRRMVRYRSVVLALQSQRCQMPQRPRQRRCRSEQVWRADQTRAVIAKPEVEVYRAFPV